MIRFTDVELTYADAHSPVLTNVNLRIDEGEFVLIVGHTGSGKSSLLHLINGIAPHHTGGVVRGSVTVDGRSTQIYPPRELADVVGVVHQDPINGFVTDTVEEEIAFGMESLGLSVEVMAKRIEEVIDLLSLQPLRHRVLATLSGGEQQRVAIAAVLALHPKVLVLDEPTSALDPTAAEEVLSTLHRLVHDLGLTVVVAEHRLERVIQYADRVIHVAGDGSISIDIPAEMMKISDLTPPIVQLGRIVGWDPLPLTTRDARRLAEPLREKLSQRSLPTAARAHPQEVLARTERLSIRYDGTSALNTVSFEVNRREVVALMGRNGAGKTTLLSALVGLRSVAEGVVELGGHEPSTLTGSALIRLAGFVPQESSDLLYQTSVAAECEQSDRDAGVVAGSTATLLATLAPDISPGSHPRDLSEGQRLLLALSVVLVSSPPLVILDEPTRGLDYQSKSRLITILRRLAAQGHGVVLATHDVELVAEVATRVVLLAEGRIVADGATVDVITASPAFAPQVAKVLAPQRWLTVDQVTEALRDA